MRSYCLAPLVVLAFGIGGCTTFMEHNLGPKSARTPPPLPPPSSTAPQRTQESPADDAPGAANNWP
jgi:hypothetical protein